MITTLGRSFCTVRTSTGTDVSALEAKVSALESTLSKVSYDPTGLNGLPTLKISGANLQIVNGSGLTFGTLNGLGNVFIGYDEQEGGEQQSGSHNLVMGYSNDFTSYGGIVAGYNNLISGGLSSVLGGIANTASGTSSVVSGGSSNKASGARSSVSGGSGGEASAVDSAVGGGVNGRASGNYSSVSGGNNGTASGEASSVSGYESSVSGGTENLADGFWSSILGGNTITTTVNRETYPAGP